MKVQTDEGITGYGECSRPRFSHAVAGAVNDLEPLLVGQDPRLAEKLYWNMYRQAGSNIGGVANIAMAGVDTALWDLKAKTLGVSVYELWVGPFVTG